MRTNASAVFASVLIGAVAALSAPADAACKKFGFTVNDYGKEGPTNDAKNLLDKHVAEWAAKSGVSEYSTGKKTVSCELFLDVILFDEHTCTASATVCWGPDANKFSNQSAAAAPAEESTNGAPPAPVRKAHALGEAVPQAAQTAAAPAEPAAAPAAEAAHVEAAPTQPVEKIAAPAETPVAAPAVHATTAPAAAPAAPAQASGTTGEVVETGALQAGQGLPPGVGPQAQRPAVSAERAAAAAAAASAAAAAERAAQAAETAANAAKEAAAAAVAASAASKSGASVPPLDHASGAKPVHNE